MRIVVLFASILFSPVFVNAADDLSTAQPQGLRDNAPSEWLLTNATVVTSPGNKIESADILIRDQKIIAIGENLQATPAARTIDLTGKTIYPGLIDAYVEQEVTTDPIKSGLPYWNDQIRPQLRVARQLKQDNSRNSTLRKQGVTALLVVPSGGIMKGSGAVVLASDEGQEKSLLKADVTQHLRLTASRGRGNYPHSPMGAVALARQALYDTKWYDKAWQAAKQNPKLTQPESNDALEALNHSLNDGVPFVADTTNELMFLRADRFAKEFDLNLIVRGSGNEYRRLDDIQATGRAVIVPVNFPKAPNVGTIEAALDASLEELMHWDHAPENPAHLEKAGITFALTSERLESRGKFLESIRLAVERGLSKTAALTALTTTPAKLFGVSDQLGTIEVGKLANLVISDGDLFEKKTEVVETWVAGKRFEFDRPEDRDVTGTWTLTMSSNPDVDSMQLEIKDKGGKLSGTIASQPSKENTDSEDESDPDQTQEGDEKNETEKKAPLIKLVLNGTRLSGTYRSKLEEKSGIVRWTLVVNSDNTTATGSLIYPDGTSETLTAEKHEAEEASSEEKQNDDKEKESKPSSFSINSPLGAYGTEGKTKPASKMAFVGATVWTCGPNGILKDATVIIENGLIKTVGVGIETDNQTQVIDAKGMHLTPGIIDCHSHMATDGGVNESGQAVSSEVRIGDFIDCDDINIYRQLAGGVTSSNILHGSANPIGGQNQVIKLRWGLNDEAMKFSEAPQGIKFALGENVKQSNWGDDYTTRYPQTRMGVEQIFIDEFRAAQEYKEKWDRWNQTKTGLPPRRDLELDAIVEILDGTRWIHCHSYRQDEILALIRVCDSFGITIGTFQHILEGYKVADAMAEHGAMGSAFSDWWAYKFEVYDAIPYAGALMHNAGVVVSFNSDDRELARHLNHEAAKAVKYGGVPPEEALKFVTLNPAKQLRIDEYVGSIEPGKHADLVLWSSSPLSTMSRCEQTWIDGRKYFDRTESATAVQECESMRNALIQKILDTESPMKKPDAETEDPETLWPRDDIYCRFHNHQLQFKRFQQSRN